MENMTESYNWNESEFLDARMNPREGGAQARHTTDAVARRSYGKLVAFLAARENGTAPPQSQMGSRPVAYAGLAPAFSSSIAGALHFGLMAMWRRMLPSWMRSGRNR